MSLPSLRPYLQLASGIGELTKARAAEAAQTLLSLPGVEEAGRRAMQATALADDLLETARANRDGLVAIVREEVEKNLARADLAKVADLDAARAALARLTAEVEDLRGLVTGGARRPSPPAAPAAPAEEATPETATPRPAAAAKKTPAKKTPAKKATAKKTTAKKTTAKKATAKKTTAKKTTGGTA